MFYYFNSFGNGVPRRTKRLLLLRIWPQSLSQPSFLFQILTIQSAQIEWYTRSMFFVNAPFFGASTPFICKRVKWLKIQTSNRSDKCLWVRLSALGILNSESKQRILIPSALSWCYRGWADRQMIVFYQVVYSKKRVIHLESPIIQESVFSMKYLHTDSLMPNNSSTSGRRWCLNRASCCNQRVV